MRMTKAAQRERDEAIADLRELLKPGDTVYTVLRHVSRSGMVHDIDVYVLRDNEPRYLSYWTAKAIGAPMHNDSVRVGGCGMDMGFHLVYSLSHVLFPDGFDCIGQGLVADDGHPVRPRCPSNDHSNDRGASNYAPTRHHASGGYALNQRWLG
jgi:hypothetical protein